MVRLVEVLIAVAALCVFLGIVATYLWRYVHGVVRMERKQDQQDEFINRHF